MSILTFPTITPNACDWGIQANTQSARSELNGVVQTLALPGDIWTAVLTFTNKFDPDARTLRAFLASLRGQAGRFYLSPSGYKKAGLGGGTPVVNGANQTGLTLNIDGCSNSITGWLKVGDYFQIGNELKIMTSDCNTNSSGQTTLNFTPPIRTAPADNSSVVIANPTCVMMLKDANQSRWQAQPTPIYALSIACEEALS